MTLEGRNAIITGASQGLGLEIARAYVRAGAKVVICARDAAGLDAAASELRVVAEPADVSNDDDARRVVARAVAELGHIDILVNNAGVYGPMGDIDTIDWHASARQSLTTRRPAGLSLKSW